MEDLITREVECMGCNEHFYWHGIDIGEVFDGFILCRNCSVKFGFVKVVHPNCKCKIIGIMEEVI